LWYNCIREFVSNFLSIQPSFDYGKFINLLKENYCGIYDETKKSFDNIIDICTMFIFSNIIHECCSNSKVSKLSTNPFTISTTWKQNDSLNVNDKINNLGEQLGINYVAYVTSLEAIRLTDKRWIEICCVNDTEKQIYSAFIKKSLKLDIPKDTILHPSNISSSISY
jgi:hypothetical protein